jgi:uncharacterized protein with FMN-binding domain
LKRAVLATAATVGGLAAPLSYKSAGPVKLKRVSVGGAGAHSVDAKGAPATTAKAAPATSAPATAPQATAGTYAGLDVQYFYGDIQVAVTVQGGKITDVSVPQNGAIDARSQMINSYAVPVLEKEALAAQGVNIDLVSGATFISEAFAQSLQSVLQKAGR